MQVSFKSKCRWRLCNVMSTGVNNRQFRASPASDNTSGWPPPSCSSWLNQNSQGAKKERRVCFLADRWRMSETQKRHESVTSSSAMTRWAALSQKTSFRFSPSGLFSSGAVTHWSHAFIPQCLRKPSVTSVASVWCVQRFFLTRLRSLQFEKLEIWSWREWINTFCSYYWDNFTNGCLCSLINITVNSQIQITPDCQWGFSQCCLHSLTPCWKMIHQQFFLIKLNFSTLYCLFICSQKESNKVRLLKLTNLSDGGFKIESFFYTFFLM